MFTLDGRYSAEFFLAGWLYLPANLYGRLVITTGSTSDKYQVLFTLFTFKHILIHLSKTTLPCCILCAGELSITKWYYAMEMEARQHLLAQVVVVTQRTPAPAYNAVTVSRDRAGLQCRGRPSRPRRLTTRRTTCPSAPAYSATAGSSVCAASDVAVVFTVRLSRPGLHQHTGPHLSA